ncbi:MAG: Hpt domain-containing protein [Burkholderiaceae bacterium]|jgi:HPt (histidine-containing phosphotransfer) domain-containing protein|nr:Hpt domain-containing protein [Burkholderiaceae bacterium]
MPDPSISPPTSVDAAADLLAALDPGSVQRLRELDPGGAHGLLERVLDTFVDSLVRHLDELHAARAGADPAGLRHVAHTLKSSAASVGALELSRWCADVERALRERPDAAPDAAALEAMAAEMQRLLSLAGRDV